MVMRNSFFCLCMGHLPVPWDHQLLFDFHYRRVHFAIDLGNILGLGESPNCKFLVHKKRSSTKISQQILLYHAFEQTKRRLRCDFWVFHFHSFFCKLMCKLRIFIFLKHMLGKSKIRETQFFPELYILFINPSIHLFSNPAYPHKGHGRAGIYPSCQGTP